MKKILFLLLLSVVSYGQGDFPEGINLGGNIETAESSKLLSQQPGTGELNYINATALPVSIPTQNALDMKLNISDLPTNLTLYPTTVASDIPGYVKMVTSIHDPDYNTVAVDVSTPVITTTSQLVSQRVSAPGVLVGQPGVFNITNFGNIRRLSGTGTATFYFEVYHRNLAGVETLICTSGISAVVSSSTYVEFTASAVWNDGDFVATDRIVVKTYANRIPGNSDPVYQVQYGGSSPVRTLLPVPFSVVDAGYELKANKSDSFMASSSITYASTKAVVDGLATKAPTTGSANYIQNQNSSAQSANMWISGKTELNDLTVNGDNILSPPYYSENFSSGVFTTGWTTYGDSNWFIDTTVGNGDSFSAKSGAISALGKTILSYALTSITQTTAVTFDYKTSSEEGYDWLDVKQDGKFLCRFSGEKSWATKTIYIEGIGIHNLQFVYQKDSGFIGGSDAVWIDNIKISNDSQDVKINSDVSFNKSVYFQEGLITKDAYIENAVLKGSVRIYNFDDHNFATQLYRWGLKFNNHGFTPYQIFADNLESYTEHYAPSGKKLSIGISNVLGFNDGFFELNGTNAVSSIGGVIDNNYQLTVYKKTKLIGDTTINGYLGLGTETPLYPLHSAKADPFGNLGYFWDKTAGLSGLLLQGNYGRFDIVGYNQTTFNDIYIRAGSAASNNGVIVKTTGNILVGTQTDDGVNKLQVNGTVSATSFNGSATLTGTPTAPTATAGTNTTQIATTAFVQANARPYKVYTALISQTGTNAPTATVLENTLGGTIVWTRSNTGQYVGTLTGAFTDQKTIIFVNRSNPAATAFDTNMAANVININTVGYTTFSNSAYVDGQTNSASIEIRVYN